MEINLNKVIMKKLGLVLIALVLFVSCEQAKIGYVDNVKLMEEYQEKIDMDAQFEIKKQAYTKKKDSITQAFRLEAQAYQVKNPNPNTKRAQEEGAVLQQKSQFIGQQLQQEEQILLTAGQTEMDSVVSRAKKGIENYGKKNGYTYILGGGDGGSVLYGQEVNDLTDEILKLLNESYKKD